MDSARYRDSKTVRRSYDYILRPENLDALESDFTENRSPSLPTGSLKTGIRRAEVNRHGHGEMFLQNTDNPAAIAANLGS